MQFNFMELFGTDKSVPRADKIPVNKEGTWSSSKKVKQLLEIITYWISCARSCTKMPEWAQLALLQV